MIVWRFAVAFYESVRPLEGSKSKKNSFGVEDPISLHPGKGPFESENIRFSCGASERKKGCSEGKCGLLNGGFSTPNLSFPDFVDFTPVRIPKWRGLFRGVVKSEAL